MEANIYNRYRIKISDSKFECIETNGEREKGFIPPDSSNKLPKLYVVRNGKEIYYVGITTQNIRDRLRQGFNAKGEHGYYGYKWKDQDTVELLVWSFPDSTKHHVEAIEAELVYFIRERTGNWPKYQMEIHFHGASEEQKRIAEALFSTILESTSF